MKLSIKSKETLKALLSAAASSSLQNPKETIAERISVSSETVQLSLDGKHKTDAARLHDSGIPSGDHLSHTLNPNGFVSNNSNKTVEQGESTTCNDNSVSVVEKKIPSAPWHLKKALSGEYFSVISELEKFNLWIIAVHAAFLDFGFVAFDRITKSRFDGFQLPLGNTRSESSFAIDYTLPHLLGSLVETHVVLLFHIKDFLLVHGMLIGKSHYGYRDWIVDQSHYVPSIRFLRDSMNKQGTSDHDSYNEILEHEGKISEFWKMIKDEIALPLLIDLCEKAGLPSPPCFNVLPREVKLKVLEYLPGFDIAVVAFVSSELKCLSKDNKLWKQKVEEEFDQPDIHRNKKDNNWKQTFVECWGHKKPSRQLPYKHTRWWWEFNIILSSVRDRRKQAGNSLSSIGGGGESFL